jgi:DNA-binding NtrC family response regulator/tetratricopeptide (TPR) repeat protein
MKLVADRFALNESGDAVDLATGARVMLIVEAAGGVPQQLQWNERCETLHATRHPAVAPLVDYGLVGPHSRFEAWACARRWRGAPDEARRVAGRAAAFLRAMNLSIDDRAAALVCTASTGAGSWVPGARSGYPTNEDESPAIDMRLVDRGVRLIERSSISALGEMFRPTAGLRSHVAALWGPPDSGKRRAVETLARMARLQGFVPVAVHLVESPLARLWHGRSVLLIAASPEPAWTPFLRSSLATPRPHVLLIVGETELPDVDGMPLRSLEVDALIASVRPPVVGGPHETAARALAAQARGLPGRFARLLWRYAAESRNRHPARIGIAAERPAVYGIAHDAALPAASPRTSCAWPAPGELAALRRKRDAAVASLAAGRHAAGIRELRQAVSGLARRAAWIDAAGGGVQLAAALLQRGRPCDAQKAIDDAREYASHGGGDALLLELAILSGHAWIDRARLDEAEAILAAAVTSARALGDPERRASASLALGRCLFWRGRFEDAAVCLDRFPESMPPHIDARRAVLSSRLAVACGDLGAAMADASPPYARAFVHLNVGDLEAADHDLVAAISAARSAHDPLRALRARLLRAEVERRRGRVASAASLLDRLRRGVAAAPPLLRARWQLASALCARGEADTAGIVEKHVSTTGLGALPLYAVPRTSGARGRSAGVSDTFVDHVLAILRVCQTADEERVVLKDVCVRVRQHTHAAAVAFIGTRGGRAHVIAADGARIDSDIAERAAAAGITIAPHRRDEGFEAAAPVIYAGSPIAALCARWTIGTTYDVSSAASALTTTAAAAAPLVAMALLPADADGAREDCGLLGVSAVMRELRRSVERAAAAPFAVLIDGESGSGKELVARAIHRLGPRRHKPFRTLNCAALPDDLVEAELFGHARGSFTGAVVDRAGVFEDAHGGTLFLDEVGELSPRAQAKVLRVIQEGELRRVGETLSKKIDVRIVAATNRELRRDVDAGRFRLDLLYRLDVVHIAVPRLRDRRDDIPLLVDHFWRDAAQRIGSRATLATTTIGALVRYDWPGNVRELQNVLAALAVRCPKRGVVPPSALPPAFTPGPDPTASRLDEARRTFEERFVRAALVRTGGHRGRAAEELGVTRQGLTKLMTRLGIAP